MSGSNALQITSPDSDSPLAQAPSWADAAQSVAGTVSGGVDALGQWLAAQRAKRPQMGLWNELRGMPAQPSMPSQDAATQAQPQLVKIPDEYLRYIYKTPSELPQSILDRMRD